jgi:hypothetical protein
LETAVTLMTGQGAKSNGGSRVLPMWDGALSAIDRPRFKVPHPEGGLGTAFTVGEKGKVC